MTLLWSVLVMRRTSSLWSGFGDEGALAGLGRLERGLAEVEAEAGLARVFIRPVAGETLARENGADIALKIRRGRGGEDW